MRQERFGSSPLKHLWALRPAEDLFPPGAVRIDGAQNRHTPHPLVARSRAAIAITAPDICSRSAYRESCGSARQVACYRSPAAWCDALAASANPFSSSVFSVRASPRIKAVRDSLSFKRRSRPECRMPLHLSALRSAEFVEDIELERD